MKDKILLGIMLIGMIFYFVIAPVTIACGIANGRITFTEEMGGH